jgi:hypothetical protein
MTNAQNNPAECPMVDLEDMQAIAKFFWMQGYDAAMYKIKTEIKAPALEREWEQSVKEALALNSNKGNYMKTNKPITFKQALDAQKRVLIDVMKQTTPKEVSDSQAAKERKRHERVWFVGQAMVVISNQPDLISELRKKRITIQKAALDMADSMLKIMEK